ncbi:hypothetical protein LOZ07_004931 [Ophidiomyces ophidiicola]|nr:hypothetical protein LOZ59_006420 [Ophidiomyces ophidiicola]KAI1977619.1 hypothetical protein LOZ55_003397 [Ophidiomyces ophidiicola]KAI2009031.1 hypothetical protein LOZ46_006541 [Ophidiomyces ophidiicola]KAI2042464.1 hypothetical protein LOZ44_006081 [Ophidiomyces ophidiicola]KAI2151076.1 hypothetical protein LOZ25_006446 [Ophidiomyces ophidiicola]
MESVEPFDTATDPPPASDSQTTVLYTVLSTEEVDSSIREFSYIWAAGGFDIGEPDTQRLGGADSSCHIAIFKIDTDNAETSLQRPLDELDARDDPRQVSLQPPPSMTGPPVGATELTPVRQDPAAPSAPNELLVTLPASCYSAERDEPYLNSDRGHRRGSSSIVRGAALICRPTPNPCPQYTSIPRFPAETASLRPLSTHGEPRGAHTPADAPPSRDDRSARFAPPARTASNCTASLTRHTDRYSDCLQGGEAYCNERHESPVPEPFPRSMKRQHFQEDFSGWPGMSRTVQSSELPRFRVDLPLPRSRSVGQRFFSKMKFWGPTRHENASSKPQSYMSHSKRSITASIASSWSRKARSYFRKSSLKGAYPQARSKASRQSIRTISPKSIFSRVQKSPASNYSDFLTELGSRGSKPNLSTCRPPPSLISTAKEPPTLDLDISVSLGEPRPFQCTFCLMQWENREEWAYHEASFHMRPYGNLLSQADQANEEVLFSMSDVVSTHSSIEHQEPTAASEEQPNEFLSLGYHLYSQGEAEPKKSESWNWLEKRSNWFWNCGFCDLLMRTWSERQDHIAEHFEEGMTMVSWNPLRSPYPISKFTLTPVEGFPLWDFSPLQSLQQPGVHGDAYGASTIQCKMCRKNFPDLDAFSLHNELWHVTPETYICPGPGHASNPGVFFDTETITADASELASLNLENLQTDQSSLTTKTIYTYDYCLCCGEIFHESPPDWDARKQHLQDMHCISETDNLTHDHRHNHGQPFYREELFSLHLANCHNVRFDYLTEFTEFCRKKAQAPVLTVQSRVGELI